MVLAPIPSICLEDCQPQPGSVHAQSAPPEAYSLVESWAGNPRPRVLNEFADLGGIASGDNRHFLLDHGQETIHVMDSIGQPVDRFQNWAGLGNAMAEARDIAYADGRLYITAPALGSVLVLDATSGGFLAQWQGLGRPMGIAAADDRVYISDDSTNQVLVYDRAGVRQFAWDAQGDDSLKILAPRGLDVHPDGSLLVADIGSGNDDSIIHWLEADGSLRRRLQPYADSDNLDVVIFDLAASQDQIYGISTYGAFSFEPDSPSRNEWRVSISIRQVGLAGICLHGWDPGTTLSINDYWEVSSGVRIFVGPGPRGARSEVQSLPSQLGEITGPQRVSTSDGPRIFVSDAWPRVQAWSKAGTPIHQTRTDDITDIVGLGDGGFIQIASNRIWRMDVDGNPTADWRADTSQGDWLAAGTLSGNKLLVAETGRGRLLEFGLDDPRTLIPQQEHSFSDQSRDLASIGDSILSIGHKSGRIKLYTLNNGLSESRSWIPESPALRIAAHEAADRFFILCEDGWVRSHARDGQLLARWPAAPGGRALDLDVDSSGKVFVVDGRKDQIHLYTSDDTVQSPDAPSQDGQCDLQFDKQASPRRVPLGDPVEVELSVSGSCPSESYELDVVLVIDQSGSMGGPKMAAARSAAVDFINELDFNQAHASVVLFSSAVTTTQVLTDESEALIRGVAKSQAFGGTNIGDALRVAREELSSERARVGTAQRAIVMMTDGKPEGGSDDPVGYAYSEAELARDAGIAIYTVGLGADIDAKVLGDIAADPNRFFAAPSSADLKDIYRAIARRLSSENLLKTIDIIDEVPANMSYIPASAQPPADWDGSRLRWQLSDIGPAGFELKYQLLPSEVGIWPTNVRAVGDYLDGLDNRGQLIFPVPEIEVFGGKIAYLPLLFQRACPEQHSDIILVIDTSGSMDDRNSPEGPRKIDSAVAAAKSFVDIIALPRDRIAVVGFNNKATIVQDLSPDRAQIISALDRLPRESGTRIDLGLAAAHSILSRPDRDKRQLPIVILLTDGRPIPGSEEQLRQTARILAEAGIHRFAIGLGADADGGLLVELIDDPNRYRYAPDQSALAEIYQTIAWTLPCQ